MAFHDVFGSLRVRGDLRVDGSMANLPAITYKKVGNNQTVTSGAETDITELTAKSFSDSPDGVKTYLVSASVGIYDNNQAGNTAVHLYVGSNGNKSDSTPVVVVGGYTNDGETVQQMTVALSPIIVTPGLNEKVGLSVTTSTHSDAEVQGNGTVASYYSYMTIQRIS